MVTWTKKISRNLKTVMKSTLSYAISKRINLNTFIKSNELKRDRKEKSVLYTFPIKYIVIFGVNILFIRL